MAEYWKELLAVLGAGGILGQVVTRLLSKFSRREKTEVKGISLDNEMRMADAWRDNFRALQQEYHLLVERYRKLSIELDELRAENRQLEDRITKLEKCNQE